MVEEGSKQAKVTRKGIKVGEMVEEGEDRMSALPDSLLVEILDRLPSTQSAIRTGTLSKRWKYLWTMVPTLIFNEYDCHLSPSDFISFVDETISQRPQLKLRKIVVRTTYDFQFEMQYNNWIHYAISCNAEELELRFNDKGSVGEAGFMLNEGFFINSCFTDLTLLGCIFNPSGVISWEKLRSLLLINCMLDEDAIENMLTGSPQLESLMLYHCYGYRRLAITSKSVKKLEFYGYKDPDDEFDELEDVIEIDAPHILSIKIHGMLLLWKIVLLNISSLVEAELDYTKFGYSEGPHKEAIQEMLKGFIQSLSHVKELRIGSHCSMTFSHLKAKGFTFPSNVKFLGHIYSEAELEDAKLEDAELDDPSDSD